MSSVTHICFLDKNPTLSITPVLDPNIQVNQVIFFIEKHQEEQFSVIEHMLKPRAIKTDKLIMPTSRKTEELVTYFHQSIDHLVAQKSDSQLVFNASSGDHQHLLALYEVIRAYPIECFMVEPDLDELHWLVPFDRSNLKLADKLKIKDFVAISGAEIEDIANHGIVEKAYRDLGAKWAADHADLGHALSQLNYLAAKTNEHTLKSEALNRSQQNDIALQTLIDDLEEAKIATRNGDILEFTSEDARFFANGGWLEEYVYGTLLTLKKDIPTLQDAAQGVEIVRNVTSGKVRNELDVVALANNKLHLIECKTKKFQPGEGNNVVYKLDSLAELLGGMDARALLVSYKGIRPSEKLRARELDIEVICEEDLADLRYKLKTWLLKA